MEKIFLRLREKMIEFPHGILVLGNLERVTTGWVVKLKGATDFEGEDGMMKAIKIATITTKTISGYKDEELELWDVVQIFDNEAEATEFGKLNEQMTIYQIETGSLRWIE